MEQAGSFFQSCDSGGALEKKTAMVKARYGADALDFPVDRAIRPTGQTYFPPVACSSSALACSASWGSSQKRTPARASTLPAWSIILWAMGLLPWTVCFAGAGTTRPRIMHSSPCEAGG